MPDIFQTQIRNALAEGRRDYAVGIQESENIFEQAYARAVAKIDAAWKTGRSDIKEMYAEAKRELQPFGDAGRRALTEIESMLQAGPGEWQESPQYKYFVEKGMDAIQRSAAAKSSLQSGRTMEALGEFVGQAAGQDYQRFLDDYYNRLDQRQRIAALGASAAGPHRSVPEGAGGRVWRWRGHTGPAQACAGAGRGGGPGCRGRGRLPRSCAGGRVRVRGG